MAQKTIAVDVDDVLAAEREFVIAYSNKQWGHELTLADYQENWGVMWDVDLAEFKRRADEIHIPERISSYQLVDGAVEALRELRKKYRLVILTSRRQVIKEETLSWLNEVFGNVFSEVHFTGFWDTIRADSHLETKGQLAKQIGANYLIDDQSKHCIAAAEVGIDALLFGGYPESRDLALPKGVTRCRDWAAVLDYFDGRD